MPRPVRVPSANLQKQIYKYLEQRELTYEEGAEIFGFSSRHAIHMWLFRERKGALNKYVSHTDKRVMKVARELGVGLSAPDETLDDLE